MYGFEDQESQLEEAPAPQRQISHLVLWLVMLGLGILYVSVYLLGGVIHEDNARLEAELVSITSTLEAPVPIPLQEQVLADQLMGLRTALSALENNYDSLTSNHINWPQVMSVVGLYDQARMVMTGLSHENRRITLAGYAQDESVVIRYVQQLRDSRQFENVSFQTMNLQTLPTATPPPAQGNTRINPTVTPSPRVNVNQFVILIDLKDYVP